MTHVTCRLTAKNWDQLQNPTLGNRVWATFFIVWHVLFRSSASLVLFRKLLKTELFMWSCISWLHYTLTLHSVTVCLFCRFHDLEVFDLYVVIIIITRLTALFLGLRGWAGTRKVKPIWILLEQETVSGSGISWTICKSAPRSRWITMPVPHQSICTGRMLFLPPNQQHQGTEGTFFCTSQ